MSISEIKNFWQTEACGSHFVKSYDSQKEFFDKYREFRYRTSWYIPEVIPFEKGRGKSVLEIGCGNGADGIMWASNGADYTGCDLTETAINATRDHFSFMALPGQFQIENAESLSFKSDSFDIVYSYGVLHHSPNTQQAINEVYRVLKPGGQAIIMLYHKHSFNYYVRIMTMMRGKVLLKILSRIGHWREDKKNSKDYLSMRGNKDKSIWDAHYHLFLENGWKYLKAKNFVHHCTDGPACPIAYVFTKKQAKKLFSQFHDIKFKVVRFPLRQYLGNWAPRSLERVIASKIGWALIIYAQK